MDHDRTEQGGLSRRQALAGVAGALILPLATEAAAQTPAAAPAKATASGSVFEDVTGDGRRSAGSQGIADVLVSNGRDVVRTDAQGRWQLPVAVGDALFVIKPTGWMTKIDPLTQIPQASYLHIPQGTPANLGFRYAGVAPTGELPESIDFPLRRQPESNRFDALLFTDPQPESLAELGYIRDDVVARTTGLTAAFGITHGDVMFDDLSFYPRSNAIVGSIGLPWYNCCGNHDMNLEAPNDTHSRETFKRVFGSRIGAFQYGGATFFLLDNVEYLGTDPSKPNAFGPYRGRFGADQLAFVRNVLREVPRDSLVVFSFHIPLKTQAGTDPATANTDTRAFLEAIATHPNSISFSGHTHTNEHWYFGGTEGFAAGAEHHHHVLSAVSGSWWSGPFDVRGIPVALASDGAPNGFHVLSVDGQRATTELVPAHDPAGAPMRIVLDSQIHRDAPELQKDYTPGALLRGPIAQAAAGSTRVVVNLFDGGPRSAVSITVGNRSPQTMTRTLRRDPFVEEVYSRNAATKKPWVQPGLSTHIWQATLPADLRPGSHAVVVEAQDEHGRIHVGGMVLEVTG